MRRELGAAALVAVVAFGARLAHVSALERHDPLFAGPALDAEYYDALAREIAAGDWTAGTDYWIHPPGYPYALGAFYHWRGTDHERPFPQRDYRAPRVAQAVVGTLGALLAGLLGWQLGGQSAGLLTGLIAGLGAALCGPLIYYDAQLLPPVLLGPLVAGALAIWLALARREEPPDPRAWLVAWAGMGLLLGLATVVRPNPLVLAAPVLLWAWTYCRRLGLPWSRRIAGLLLFLVALATPLIATTARNAWVVERPVMLVVKGGFNVWLGNNPDAARTSRLRPGAEFNAIYRRPITEAGIRDQAEQDRWFWAQVRAYAAEHPLEFGGRLLAKWARVFAGVEEKRNFSIRDARPRSPVLAATCWPAVGFPMALVAPLALLGLLRVDRRLRTPCLLLLATYAATIALGYTAARYRVPLWHPLLALAAVGALSIRQASRRAALAAVAVAIAVQVPTEAPDPVHAAELRYYEAMTALKHDRPDEARALLDESLRLRPLVYAHMRRAALSSDAEARAHLEAAIRLDPDQWAAHYEWARRVWTADRPASQQALRRALAIDPTRPEPHLLLGDLASDPAERRRHWLEAWRLSRPGSGDVAPLAWLRLRE